MPTKLIPEDCRFEPSIMLAHNGIIIRPALRLLTLATSEERVNGIATDVGGRPRTTCVPFVLAQNWTKLFPDPGAANFIQDGRRFYFPLSLEFDKSLSFDVVGGAVVNMLQIFTNQGQLEFPVSETFASFVRLTETLGLMVPVGGDNTYRIVSVRQRGSDLTLPQVGDAGVLMSDAKFEKTLETPKAWRAKFCLSPELYVDQVNDSITYEHYYIGESDRRVSKTLVQEICLLCQTTNKMTREHCTPRWLMTKMNLRPIVATIFCSSCNSEQGRRLESPMEQSFISGSFLRDEELTNMWALKTALTLAASQNIRVPRVMAEAVRSGDVSLGGAEVLALHDETLPPEGEFRFIVASLRKEDYEKGRFALLFTFFNYSFLVLRWSHESTSLETLVRDLCSTQYEDMARLGTLHVLLERLSGTKLASKMPGETWL